MCLDTIWYSIQCGRPDNENQGLIISAVGRQLCVDRSQSAKGKVQRKNEKREKKKKHECMLKTFAARIMGQI